VTGANDDPELFLSRADASKEINSTADRSSDKQTKWNANQALKTGAWKVEYRSGKKVCNTTNLTEVTCVPGYEEKNNECIATAEGICHSHIHSLQDNVVATIIWAVIVSI
jgi:hypothetical protein